MTPAELAGFVGKVCVCPTGRVGLAVRVREITMSDGFTGTFLAGIGLDGQALWCTRNPIMLHPSIEAYMDRLALVLTQPGAIYLPLG